MEGNLDFSFDLVNLDILMGHLEETSSMKLDRQLEVIGRFWAENGTGASPHRTGCEQPGERA